MVLPNALDFTYINAKGFLNLLVTLLNGLYQLAHLLFTAMLFSTSYYSYFADKRINC